MEKLKKLQSRLAEIDGKIDALLEHDELTADQRAEHDKLKADRAKVVQAIADQKDRLAREAERTALDRETAAADREREAAEERDRRTVATVPATPRRHTTADAATPNRIERRDEQGRVTSFFEETDEEISFRVGEAADAVMRRSYKQQCKQNTRLLKQLGYSPWAQAGGFTSFADFVRDGLENHTNSSFRERHNAHLSPINKHAAVLGMSEGQGADGGYTVMPEFARGIIDRIYTNDLWGRTDNYSVTGNNMTFLANAETSRATGSRHGGMRGYWLAGEGAALTASKPTLREVTLKLKKAGVLVYLTQELLDDGGFALQEYVTRKAGEEFNFMFGDSLVNGTGAGQPLGMLNFPSLISISAEAGQLADTILPENVVKMHSRFYAGGLSRRVFLHNQDIGPQLHLMTLGIGAAGVTVYLPPGGLSTSPYASLMGSPMLPTEFNPTLGDVGDLLAADMGQIVSISKGGVAQAVSMHVQFLTDQLALRFIVRVDAGPWETSAITPYKGAANTQSNFVAIAAR